MKSVLIIAAGVLLTACSTTRYSWQHPDGLGELERQSAKQTCEQLAYAEAPTYFARSTYRFGYHGHRHPHHHLYYYHPDPYALRRALIRVCMQAKGWRREKEAGAGYGG